MYTLGGNTIRILVLAFGLFTTSNSQSYGQPPKNYLQPIVPTQIGQKIDDLSFLDSWIKKPKVVGLGEVTHGTKEIFQFKSRLVQYLALKKKAQAIVIEANMADCFGINQYITTGEGNPSELIRNLRIATMNYKEYVDLLVMLKDINLSRKQQDKIEFWGYDVQAPQAAAKMAMDYFEKNGLILPDTVKNVVTALIKTGNNIFAINPKNVPVYSKAIDSLYTMVAAHKATMLNTNNKAIFLFHERLIYVVKQSFVLFTAKSQMDAFFMRDKLGFENIKWIIEAKKKHPVIFWAHNAHVLKKELLYDKFVTTGNCLADVYKGDYVAIGSVFYEGTVRAIKDEKLRKYEDIEMPTAEANSAEAFLAAQPYENYFLHIGIASKVRPWTKVLTDSTVIRSIGSAYQPTQPGRNYRKTLFSQQFDLLFFIRKSSAPTENK
jgi:erythromycin esterase